MLHRNGEVKGPTILALLENKLGGIVAMSEEDQLLVQDIGLLFNLGNLCGDEADKVDLDAGVFQIRARVKMDMPYVCSERGLERDEEEGQRGGV